MRLDNLVEGALHVEHHRVKGAGSGDSLDRPRCVVECGEPHCLSKPSCWIDGEDAHPSTLLRGTQGNGSRRGRLANAAGSGAHDDSNGPITEDAVDAQWRGIDR